MDILIIGSSGFLGKEVTITLKKSKYNLTFLSRDKVTKKNHIFCNLKNPKKLNSILEFAKPDVIINLAADVNLQNKTKHMDEINFICPNIIAKYCKKNDAHFIQASSILVHGINTNYSIKTKYNPINYYSKSKLKADNLIIKTKCRYSILRFGGIYGKNGPSHLGINKFINMALQGEKLIFNGNRNNLRNYIFVKDAARVILKCLKYKKLGIFYVGGEILSIGLMLEKINKVLGKTENVLFKVNGEKINNQIIKTDKFVKYTSFKKSLELIR